MPKVVPVPDDVYARQKAEVEARCVEFEVIGEQPMRDAVTRDAVEKGGIVRLDPATTNFDLLFAAHAIRPVDKPATPAAKTTEA